MSSAVSEELSRRRLIYLIISIVFSLNCFANLAFTAWKNGDDKLPISMVLLDNWNMASVGVALPFLLAFLMAFDCGCDVTKQFSKFLFVFFSGSALVSLIVNFLLNKLSPHRDLFLEIFGYKPGNVTIDLSQEQKDEIKKIMESPSLATEVNITMYKNKTNSVEGVVETTQLATTASSRPTTAETTQPATTASSRPTTAETTQTDNLVIMFNTKLFVENPTEDFFAIDSKGEKIKITEIKDNSTGLLTMVTLEKAFNQTPVKDNKIILIKEEDYTKQEKIIRDQTKKDLEDSYQNVDAKYKRHPLNYSMRNVWLWLIFATSLFTHSIVVFSGFAYKRSSASSPAIDLDLL